MPSEALWLWSVNLERLWIQLLKLWDGTCSGRSAAEIHAAVLSYAPASNAEVRQGFAPPVSGN